MRYAFVAVQQAHYPVRVLCKVMQVSASGFYGWRRRQGQPDPEATLRAQLRRVHANSRGSYGRPRLVHALRATGHTIGHKRVARLMREEGLRGKVKGGVKPRTTDSAHSLRVADNTLQRQFDVAHPQPAWAGDITYIATREGWLYLAVVIDLRTRQVRGYCVSDRMHETLVRKAFCNAYARAGSVPTDIVFHSDRGSQYASTAFTNTLRAHGFTASMSRVGNCWDNAVAESFFATLKNEEATGVYASKAAAKDALAHYIHGFYNPTRLHSSLGYRSPDDYAKQVRQAA